jgi:hypothetical protein
MSSIPDGNGGVVWDEAASKRGGLCMAFGYGFPFLVLLLWTRLQ